MTVTPEEIAAFADGELTGDRLAEVEAAIAADPELAHQVERHRALRGLLAKHYEPVALEEPPKALTALLMKRDNVVPIGSAEAAARKAGNDNPRAPSRRWQWFAGPAMAAGLALAVFGWSSGGGFGNSEGSAVSGNVAGALDGQLVAMQDADAPVQVLLSFRDEAGAICRAYAEGAEGAIACRSGDGWRVRDTMALPEAASGAYRQAASDTAPLMEAAQAMAGGRALTAAEEEQARAEGWR